MTTTKNSNEVFVFENGSFQQFPNHTDEPCTTINIVDFVDSSEIVKFNNTEHNWVKSELANVELELMYHWTSDDRAKSTEDEWKRYARDLRNYTTTDENDVPSVLGDERPSKPV